MHNLPLQLQHFLMDRGSVLKTQTSSNELNCFIEYFYNSVFLPDSNDSKTIYSIKIKFFDTVGRRPNGSFHWGNDGFVIKVGTVE